MSGTNLYMTDGVSNRLWYSFDHATEKPGKALVKMLIVIDILLGMLIVSLVISALVFHSLSKKEYNKYGDQSVDFNNLTL